LIGIRYLHCWADISAIDEDVVSPLLLDVYNLGYPDLLAGPNAWPLNREKSEVVESTTRVFDLNCSGAILYQWVGPKTGILVYGKNGVMPLGRISGLSLFGTFFGGRHWSNGYEALASLDKAHKGYLEGEDLKEVFVWVDRNGDGLIQPGEIVAASTLVTRLDVTPKTRDHGVWNPKGALLKDGSEVSTWDWWSRGKTAMSLTDSRAVSGAASEPLHVYQWEADPASTVWFVSLTKLPFPKGYFRFLRNPETGKLYVVSVSSREQPRQEAGNGRKKVLTAYLAEVKEGGGSVFWEFGGSLVHSLTGARSFDGMKSLVGWSGSKLSRSGPMIYDWYADLVHDEKKSAQDPAYQALLSLSSSWLFSQGHERLSKFDLPVPPLLRSVKLAPFATRPGSKASDLPWPLPW